MESTNQIRADAIESTKYGSQITQLKNGRLEADRPPAQFTINHLKLYEVRSRCLIQHSASPHAVSATQPHLSCHKAHKGLLTNTLSNIHMFCLVQTIHLSLLRLEKKIS